jgi:hypothetical protein
MSDKRKTTKRDKKRAPAFLATARRFYGEAFGSRTRREYLESMADWAELSEDDQTFTLAHLQYLNLLAQARTQGLLVQVRDLLDEVAEGLGDVLDPEDDDEDGADHLEGGEDFPSEPEELPDDLPEEGPEFDGELDQAEDEDQHGAPSPLPEDDEHSGTQDGQQQGQGEEQPDQGA